MTVYESLNIMISFAALIVSVIMVVISLYTKK
ncbi:putative holin-like toxin [Bacillus songklensis]|uniref:Holin-like toxin n=1 Tax=Bacillus songklensis TaxID=1069116 RepID=A0ABV8AWN6_9BACI